MAETRRRDSRPLLIVMLKAPRMGSVKTRLARDIGLAEATRFARVCAIATITRLRRDPRWRVLLAVTPDSAARDGAWPKGLPRTSQGRGDLGARMGRLLVAHKPALLIGADIPAVSPGAIAQAFALLRRSDVVLGPAEDGGYWLIGFNRLAPRQRLFAGVRWSTPFALADTIASLSGARIAHATRLADVDGGEDYRRARAIAGRVIMPRLPLHPPGSCPTPSPRS